VPVSRAQVVEAGNLAAVSPGAARDMIAHLSVVLHGMQLGWVVLTCTRTLVLLENVAGAYTALRLGATCICPPLATVGMDGAVGLDADRCLEAIREHGPRSLIVLPQMLHPPARGVA